MDTGLVVAVVLAAGFAITNGLHDASNAIATLVATRAATPLQAIVLAVGLQPARPVAPRRRGRRHHRRHRHRRAVGSHRGDRGGARRRGCVEPRHLAPRPSIQLRPRARRRPRGREPRRGRDPRGQLGRAGRLASRGRLRHADRAGGLAAARRACGAAGDPRAAPARAARHTALAGTGPRGRVGDVGRARVQPRRERRAEVGRRDRRASARGRTDRHVRGSRRGRSSCARRRSPPAPRSADGGSFAPWAAASTASGRSRVWPARPPPRA